MQANNGFLHHVDTYIFIKMKNIIRLIISILIISFSLLTCKKDEHYKYNEDNVENENCESDVEDEKIQLENLEGTLDFFYENSNINEWCSSLFFINKLVGFASTQSGKIYKTRDGGVSWRLLGQISPVHLNSIFFVDGCTGYAFGGKSGCSPTPCTVYGSVAYKTTDGGKSWIRQTVPYEWSELYSAWFFNNSLGLVVGLGLSVKTSDGGNTWEAFTTGDKNNMKKVSFVSLNVGHCVSLMGDFFRTEDMGITWKKIIVGNDNRTSDFCFISNNVGYANDVENLMKSIDGGNTWDLIYTADYNIGYINFITENIGIILGSKYLDSGYGGLSYSIIKIQFTKDGGKTWSDLILDERDFNLNCISTKDNILYSLSYDNIVKLTIR
jgi:photosystem II stability/assembly factor-like uncharacterized protein